MKTLKRIVLILILWILSEGPADKALGEDFFMGTAIGFGESYSTKGGNPALGMSSSIEGGYIFNYDEWSNIELGVEGFISQAGYTKDREKAKIAISGMLLKGGYSYKLGRKAVALWKLGLGPSFINYSATQDEIDFNSKKTILGLSSHASFNLLLEFSPIYTFIGGLKVTHTRIDIDSLRSTPNTERAVKRDLERQIAIYAPELYLGIRVKI